MPLTSARCTPALLARLTFKQQRSFVLITSSVRIGQIEDPPQRKSNSQETLWSIGCTGRLAFGDGSQYIGLRSIASRPARSCVRPTARERSTKSDSCNSRIKQVIHSADVPCQLRI